MLNDKLTVSIVIPCRNEGNYIEKCIEGFMDQTYPSSNYEVLICDGMSTDGTRDIIEKYQKLYSNVKLVDNPGLTAPKAMNKGIKTSHADVIIIFGAHAYPERDFIERNIEALSDDEIGCVGGTLETINETEIGKGISLAMSSPFGVGNALFRYSKKEAFVDTVAFGAYRRSVLDKAGYFDEELVRNQDDELNLRVRENGCKILLSPKIKSYYYSRASYKKLWKQYFQYGFWKVRVFQKHKKVPQVRHLVPMLFVIFNIFGLLSKFISIYLFMCYLLILLIYLALALFQSLKLGIKNKTSFLSILITFPILHLSYGLGFLEGLIIFYLIKNENFINKNTNSSR